MKDKNNGETQTRSKQNEIEGLESWRM
jgi:hypothetical protein